MNSRARVRTLAAALLLSSAPACIVYEPLRRQAATDLSCTTSQVEIYEQEGLYQATGCGHSALYHCQVDNQSQQHCTPMGRTEVDTVKMVSPPVLRCSRNRLKIEARGEGLYLVEGCGRQATILCRQNLGYFHCEPR